MKSIIAIAAFGLLFSANAFECSQNEAQFIGTVKNLRVLKIDQGIRDCFYKIEFSSYQAHGLCPLSEGRAYSAELLDSDCSMSLTEGQEISGYLVEKNGYIYLD